MKILYINNDGGGFADRIEIEPGTTVLTLFEDCVEGRPSDYLIRVNRQPAPADYELQEGDRISFTPVKIEGAIMQAANRHVFPSAKEIRETSCSK